ncbi:kinase-like domain-containing protein [Mycotypha africana]|uniref:kinase-like domain-containing protein n=1 Tax=Mycotypha africana TaxID=64632 RepID=UPI002300716B|nr:kinase-like domain-containing protein [Mycotypha africana]KAI8977357.1 kinase-like domain-containing protein [Mycotypha africana]
MTRWLNSPLKRRYSQIWKGSSSKSQQKTHKFIRGRYKFLHQLGQGTSGTVYLAIDIDTNKQYAIKEINKSWLAKQHLTLKELPHHTNIIRFIDTFEDPQYPDALYIVMEVAEKGIVMDVSSYEKCKPYSESMCKTIFKQLVEAVEHLHKNNIVHRDIKPQNLVQTKDNIIKLIDFGSAMDVNKCHNYQIGKSPAFMAPELLNKEYSSFSSDIWAMGVTLFCLINGHLPFQQLSLPDLYQDILIEK